MASAKRHRQVALVVTELATNLIKHGGGGEILLGAYRGRRGQRRRVSLPSTAARGMANVELVCATAIRARAPQETVSARSFASRISSMSPPGRASAPPCWRASSPARRPERERSRSGWGAVSIAMPGEAVCGDSWTVSNDRDNVHAVCRRWIGTWAGGGRGRGRSRAAVPSLRRPSSSDAARLCSWRVCARPAARRFRSRASIPCRGR